MEVIDNYPKFRISVKINQGVNLRKFKKKKSEKVTQCLTVVFLFSFSFFTVLCQSQNTHVILRTYVGYTNPKLLMHFQLQIQWLEHGEEGL